MPPLKRQSQRLAMEGRKPYAWLDGMVPAQHLSKRARRHMLPGSCLLTPPFIKIDDSLIEGAGQGAFAAEDLPKGAYLGSYRGKFLADWDKAMTVSDEASTYYFTVGGHSSERPRAILDAADPKNSNWTRCMNCAASRKEENIRPRSFGYAIEFYTRRPVAKGEELLYYYGDDYAETIGISRKRKHSETL